MHTSLHVTHRDQMMSVYYKAQQTDSALAYWRTLVTLDGIDGVEIQIQSYLLALEMVLFDAQWDEFRAILDLMHVSTVCFTT